MIEVRNSQNTVLIKDSEGAIVHIDTKKMGVSIEGFDVNFPGEYEKSGILSEVKEYEGSLFYSLSIEGKTILIIFQDSFEVKEEILEFFGDVDVLLISGTKSSPKIIENVEARVVIPFGEGKDLCLHTLGQHKEEIDVFKLKSDMGVENTEYVNLKI